MLIVLQPITLIDFVHEVAERLALLCSCFTQPQPDQRLNVDLGSNVERVPCRPRVPPPMAFQASKLSALPIAPSIQTGPNDPALGDAGGSLSGFGLDVDVGQANRRHRDRLARSSSAKMFRRPTA
jgi:hypothetical protein